MDIRSMKEKDLLTALQPTTRAGAHIALIEAAELKTFFRERGVTYAKIAAVLEVTRGAVSSWFNGHTRIPLERQRQLIELKTKIEKWEEKHHGKRFGT
jgi:DNA-binding transcriptional regulator YiaG